MGIYGSKGLAGLMQHKPPENISELLGQSTSYLYAKGRGKKKVYEVRKAAKEALESMGEAVNGIIVEELITL